MLATVSGVLTAPSMACAYVWSNILLEVKVDVEGQNLLCLASSVHRPQDPGQQGRRRVFFHASASTSCSALSAEEAIRIYNGKQ